MADNVGYTPGTGATVSADEVTYSGDTSLVQLVRPVLTTGAEGSKTVVELTGDATYGLDVDVTRLPALPAGSNTIGTVIVSDGAQTISIDAAQADGESNSANSLHTSSRTYVFNGTSWDRARGDITNGLDVDVTRLPALPTGSNQIGTVNISDGTNALAIDTAFGDAESGTLNHLDVAARLMAVNAAGTFDMVRATVTGFKCAQYTSAQTGTALWTPATGKAVVITAVQIQSYGTTAGTAILWFGASGDTTYTRGTDAPLFDGEFAPSNTNKPGVYVTYPTPMRGTADYVLRVTTTNAQSVTFNVWGYEI